MRNALPTRYTDSLNPSYEYPAIPPSRLQFVVLFRRTGIPLRFTLDLPVSSMPPISHQLILHDLVQAYGQTHPCIQFATYISAYQYLRLYALMQKYVPPGSAVLDWGTGSGHFSHFLMRAGYQASGFGFTEYPRLCQNIAPDRYNYQQGTPAVPTALPFIAGEFDAVVSVGVLEHVRETGGNELASLREIHRILKPGGLFICYHLPNRYSWLEYLARVTHRFSHAYRFTAADIQTWMQATPFDLLEMGRYALLPRNIWQLPQLRAWPISPFLASVYNQLDTVLGALLPIFCQNYFYVARKPDAPPH